MDNYTSYARKNNMIIDIFLVLHIAMLVFAIINFEWWSWIISFIPYVSQLFWGIRLQFTPWYYIGVANFGALAFMAITILRNEYKARRFMEQCTRQ